MSPDFRSSHLGDPNSGKSGFLNIRHVIARYEPHCSCQQRQRVKVYRLSGSRVGGFTVSSLVTIKLNNPLMLNVALAELDLLRCQTREHRGFRIQFASHFVARKIQSSVVLRCQLTTGLRFIFKAQ